MSNYSELRRLGIAFRPIDIWPGDQARHRRRATFSASLGSTMSLLGRELSQLNARLIVVQIAMSEADFRNDGIPYANARATHPGVIIAFESRHGPLKFAVDTFTSWEDNLRAIALGMEALRKVDRYGVTKRGEQYTGWKALPRGSDDLPDGRDEALATIHSAVDDLYDLNDVDGPFRDEAVREALRRTHPDHGGDPDKFRRVIRARELLA